MDETYESVFMSPKDRLGAIVDPRQRILYNYFPKTKANLGSRKSKRVDLGLGNHDCILPHKPILTIVPRKQNMDCFFNSTSFYVKMRDWTGSGIGTRLT